MPPRTRATTVPSDPPEASADGSHAPSTETEDTFADVFTNLTVDDVPNDVADDEPETPRGGFFSRFRRNKNQDRKSRPVIPMPKGGVAGPIAALYRKIGGFIKPFDAGCGTAMIMGADDCGKAWEEVCKRNPQIRRYALMLISTGANMELIVAHAPILAAVAIHHVPAVRQMVTETTENMTKLFNAEMEAMRKENVFQNVVSDS